MTAAALLSTRPEGDRDPLAVRLRAAGRRVHAVPTVAVEPLVFEPPDWSRFDWVVVTSAAGAAALFERCTDPPAISWAAVGPGTAAALASRGVTAAAVPDEHRGVGIADAIGRVEPLLGRRVLLARADAAASDLPEALTEAGALVEEMAVYHTVIGPEGSRAGIATALADPELGAVVFASGSAVRGLLRLARQDPRHLPAITIGPSTSQVAQEQGFRVLAQASTPGVEGLIAAIADAHV